MFGRTVLAALLLSLCASVAPGEIIVDPPQTITRRVTVQLIQTALDNGSSPATVFGNAAQRADIEQSIDSIWAQAGIDIAFLPTINRYNSTFAYQGNSGSATRPTGDFSTIFANASNAGGILNPDPLILNLIMMNVVPAFPPLSDNSSAGYARVGGNGMTGYVGDRLLTFGNGLDVVASVMAHEIGHNLGLNHTASNQPNLMSPSGDTEELNSSQIGIARSSVFARVVAAQLAGDYNGNGGVDAADYIAWRKNNGTQTAYNTWRMRFGETGGSSGGGIHAGVPEPATAIMLIIGVLLMRARPRALARRGCRGRRRLIQSRSVCS